MDHSPKEQYEDDEGRQLRSYPKKWIVISDRYEPGDRIEMLGSHGVLCNDDEIRDLKGQIGTVIAVNDGSLQPFPPRWHQNRDDEYDDGVWLGQSTGWLTVQFPFDVYRDDQRNYAPRACLAEDEDTEWRKLERQRTPR